MAVALLDMERKMALRFTADFDYFIVGSSASYSFRRQTDDRHEYKFFSELLHYTDASFFVKCTLAD